MSNWNEIEPLIEKMISAIFDNNDYHNLSIYERRRKIYDHLCDTLEFDEEELLSSNKKIKKQIMNVLNNHKGVCNSISYIYKILLEESNYMKIKPQNVNESDNFSKLIFSVKSYKKHNTRKR